MRRTLYTVRTRKWIENIPMACSVLRHIVRRSTTRKLNPIIRAAIGFHFRFHYIHALCIQYIRWYMYKIDPPYRLSLYIRCNGNLIYVLIAYFLRNYPLLVPKTKGTRRNNYIYNIRWLIKTDHISRRQEQKRSPWNCECSIASIIKHVSFLIYPFMGSLRV